MKRLVLTFLLLLLPSCAGSHHESSQDHQVLVDLVESTHIIRTLINKNKLSDLLEEHDPEQLALLLDNFSPAQLAFEAEVNTSTVPAIVVYYFQDSPSEQALIAQLKSLALEYDDRVKFVIVDVEKLFSLAQEAEIEKIPTAILIKDNTILSTISDALTLDVIKQAIQEKLL
jgi:thioredoxin-like negative regulator of GroEL